MSLEVEMSTDVSNLPETSDSDGIDQNELVDKILAEMNSKTQNTSEIPVNSDEIQETPIKVEKPIPTPEPSDQDQNLYSSPQLSNLKEVSTDYKPAYVSNITNIPYRTIVYSTLLSIFLYLLFTSKLSTNILQQIPYMYNEENKTLLGGILAVGLFGFISLIGNYYIQLQF